MRLVLFDIDGTLVDCGGQPRPLFARALATVFGTAGAIDGYDFSGRTDPRIVFDLVTGAGVAAAGVWARMPEARDHYLDALETGLDRAHMRLLPAVAEVLRAFAAREDLALGLLTGNWERGARIKLSRFDLNGYFSFGAFGDEQLDRRDLPPMALARAAQATGRVFLPEQTLIVGDAVLDVECARTHSLPMLAVATGRTPAADLAAAGADWVLPDLSRIAEVPWLAR